MRAFIVVILIFVLTVIITGCYSKEETNRSMGNRYYDGEPVYLEFPFKNGDFYISQGGYSQSQNYHYWSSNFRKMGIYVSMRYAVDIHKMGEAGIDKNIKNPKNLTDFAMFGENL